MSKIIAMLITVSTFFTVNNPAKPISIKVAYENNREPTDGHALLGRPIK